MPIPDDLDHVRLADCEHVPTAAECREVRKILPDAPTHDDHVQMSAALDEMRAEHGFHAREPVAERDAIADDEALVEMLTG